MLKYITISILLFNSTDSFSQDYISFRNTLNEANYWFYEGNFDSAMVYYTKAEKYKLPFFPEEVHLFSRNLWELGYKKKSIKVLKSGGLKDYFLRDTTYYQGLDYDRRKKVASKLKLVEVDLLPKNMVFYENLHQTDQMYRKVILNYPEGSHESDSIKKLMYQQDSINFYALINEIKRFGYPGGYKLSPIGPGAVLLHASTEWLLNSYHIFLKEIEAGRMSYYDFSMAIDRKFVSNDQERPYNSYIPVEETQVSSPIMVFVNRCSIGMSPYYDIYKPRLYPRGKTPQKSKLYEYYKRSKQNFNCIRIKQ